MIGIGTDLVDLDRFREALARTPGLVPRLFCADEQAYAERRNDPTERYAARFAAKEAVMKGLGACEFTDIEVVRDDDSGAPAVALHGRARELAEEAGVSRWLLTLTHSDTTAHAIAVAL